MIEALQNGDLDRGRYTNYLKLRREIAFTQRKQDEAARLTEKRRVKALNKAVRQVIDSKRGRNR